MKVEENRRIEEFTNAILKRKTNEYSRIEQEVVTLRENLEKERFREEKFKISYTMLGELIVG